MTATAFIPLAVYFFVLTWFFMRRRPTLLSDTQDFMLLACGLFGLVTLGPGRLLIPLNILTFWGLSIWVFWTMFYFAAAYLLTLLRSRRKIVVYHYPVALFLPRLFELGRQFDPQARLDGNVLTLPGLGVQCSITADALDGHLVLLATGLGQGRHRWFYFQRGLAALCRSTPVPVNRLAFFWAGLALVVLALAAWRLASDAPVLLESFLDHWF